MSIEYQFTLPYITDDLPGTGGQLRTSPSHFLVEELPLYDPSGEGQHLYVNVTKEGLTTRNVQMHLARVFNLSNRDVGFAGMKDKHARTTQTFSVNVGLVDDAFVQEATERIAAQVPVELNWVQLHRNKLKKGHLLGNRFTIVVSHLPLPTEEALARANAIAERIRARGLPNYYGPQRLGQQGSNVHRGMALIQGERISGDRWLRNLLKASVQSYLCNRYLTRRVDEGLFDQLLLGDVAKKYDTGGLFEVKDVAAEQPRYERKEISFTAPIYGPKMWVTNGPAGDLEASVLQESDLSLAQLAKAGLSGTRRVGRLIFTDLEIAAHPEGIAVSFSLTKGAFATTVLREIMKTEDSVLASVPSDDDE